jgi:hypothetical protein
MAKRTRSADGWNATEVRKQLRTLQREEGISKRRNSSQSRSHRLQQALALQAKPTPDSGNKRLLMVHAKAMDLMADMVLSGTVETIDAATMLREAAQELRTLAELL